MSRHWFVILTRMKVYMYERKGMNPQLKIQMHVITDIVLLEMSHYDIIDRNLVFSISMNYSN